MRPEERDPAYLWDMLEGAKEVEAMLKDHDLAAFLAYVFRFDTIKRTPRVNQGNEGG